MIARTLVQGDAVVVQEDPIVEKMLPTGWCLLCKFKTHSQSDAGTAHAYYRHKRNTGHDAWAQRKFRPADRGRTLKDGPPTFKCKLVDCPFTTSAKHQNMIKKALKRHHAETGHSALVKIPGAVVDRYADKEDEHAINPA